MVCFQKAGKFILKDLDFYVPKGTAVGVIGASGAGKTTLLKLACGLLESETGHVRTMGKNPVSKRRRISSRLRAYFAEYCYFQPEDTVRSQFEIAEAAYPQERANEYRLLESQFGIRQFLDKPVKKLSLGQRRRAELAAVLMGEADLYLFDEPTNGLDEQGKRVFWEQLQKKKESGASILVSSHNMEEIRQVCDRIILLDQGRVLYYGDRDGLLRRFAPVNQMEIRFAGKIPDMEDIPVMWYDLEQDKLRPAYNTNHISAAEIIQGLIRQTRIVRIHMRKQTLSDVIMAMELERRDDG